MNLLLLVVLATIAVVLGCKENGCDTHLDFGSCGNACCRLYIKTKDTPEQVMEKMNSTLLAVAQMANSAATMAGGGSGSRISDNIMSAWTLSVRAIM